MNGFSRMIVATGLVLGCLVGCSESSAARCKNAIQNPKSWASWLKYKQAVSEDRKLPVQTDILGRPTVRKYDTAFDLHVVTNKAFGDAVKLNMQCLYQAANLEALEFQNEYMRLYYRVSRAMIESDYMNDAEFDYWLKGHEAMLQDQYSTLNRLVTR